MSILWYPLVVVFGELFTLFQDILPASLVMPVVALFWIGAFAGLLFLAVQLLRRRRVFLGVLACVAAAWELVGPLFLLLNSMTSKG